MTPKTFPAATLARFAREVAKYRKVIRAGNITVQ